MLRPTLLTVCLVAAAFAGCAGPGDPGERFAVVTVTGEIVEEGPDRDRYECDQPSFGAGLRLADERLTVREGEAPAEPLRLALWDDVVAVHAGNWSACEWPVLVPSADGELNWTLVHNAYERTFAIGLANETLTVEDQRLGAGGEVEVPIRATVQDAGERYSYRGNLTFAFHGLWGADGFERVADEGDLVGEVGTLAPER
jgi:hypothetical protein